MTALHPPTSHASLPTVRIAWRGPDGLPGVRAAAATLSAVVLVVALAVVALAALASGSPDGARPSPVPRNNEPSAYPVGP